MCGDFLSVFQIMPQPYSRDRGVTMAQRKLSVIPFLCLSSPCLAVQVGVTYHLRFWVGYLAAPWLNASVDITVQAARLPLVGEEGALEAKRACTKGIRGWLCAVFR